jgi:two-component system, NtrC family, sensor kinase
MTERKSAEDHTTRLRRRAEERREETRPENVQAMAEQDVRMLVHELQVHQIELEMQNEELRNAQEQLGESLAKYSDLYDFAPVGYVTFNRAGLILEANLTFAGQLGIERGRLIDTPFWLYTAVSDRSRFQSHLDDVLKFKEPLTCELQLERQSGPKRFVQLHSIHALDVAGVEFCRTSVTDISARKEAENDLVRFQDELEKMVEERTAELLASEKKLRKLSQEFQTLLDSISDTLVLFSPQMRVLWTNAAAATELNETIFDVIGKYCKGLLHDLAAPLPGTVEPKDHEECPIERCFNTGEKEVAVVTHNGAVLNMRAFPIKEAGRVGSVLLLVSDITEKMALQAEAMQAAHLASLGELAAGVAHEINNPITGIINYGQILINECSPASLEKDIGERIVKEGERIGRIVQTLLSYSRDEQLQRKPACVSAILEESIVLTQAQFRKEGIAIKIDLAADLPEVDANFQQIQQAFINIINNARYALNEKYPERHNNKRFEILGESVTVDDRRYARIIFYDHGAGILAHEIPLITKPFYSTKPFGKGTGLGLNITKKIITEHGGRLCFESSKGEFTRVIVDLPAMPCETET